MARNDIHNVNSRPILITSVSRPVSNICQINNGLLLQAYNIPMKTTLYCHIHLSTAHSPLNLSHLPINPSILSSAHSLTLPVWTTRLLAIQSSSLLSICPPLHRQVNMSTSLLYHPSSTQSQHHLFRLPLDL